MDTITNKFTSLLNAKLHPQRHVRDNNGQLPVYQQLPNGSVGSLSPSLPRSLSSTERPLPSRVHAGQPREEARSRDFSSSSETLDCLGEQDATAPLSLRPSHMSFKFSMRLPALKHFLSDFTLGFADGLTVPFALTAGLSSLGQTKTVIYGGMVEICAGSISMGISGYLAAREEHTDFDDDSDLDTPGDHEAQEGEEKMPLRKVDEDETETIEKYLSPLHLPPSLREQVLEHARLAAPSLTRADLAASSATTTPGDETPTEPPTPSAILSGLSISLGYLLGGILPLFPYFFVDKVTDGLAWSFGVCVLALFLFGFGKAYALGFSKQKGRQTRAVKWRRVKRSIWEGLRMAVLGSIAAGAAIRLISQFRPGNVNMHVLVLRGIVSRGYDLFKG